MTEIAIQLRLMQLLAQNCHNLVSRSVFMPDHELLGSLYDKYVTDYDSVVERMIGLNQTPDLVQLQVQAAQKLTQIPLTYKENAECFRALYQLEKQLQQMIEMTCKSGKCSQGTIQLLGDIANQSEMNSYKMGQRIKK